MKDYFVTKTTEEDNILIEEIVRINLKDVDALASIAIGLDCSELEDLNPSLSAKNLGVTYLHAGALQMHMGYNENHSLRETYDLVHNDPILMQVIQLSLIDQYHRENQISENTARIYNRCQENYQTIIEKNHEIYGKRITEGYCKRKT